MKKGYIQRPSFLEAIPFHGTELVHLIEKGAMGEFGVDYVKLPSWCQLKPHIHKEADCFIIVARGFGELIIGDERKEIWNGHYAFIPKGTPHAFSTRVDTLEFYSLQSPCIFREGQGEDFHILEEEAKKV